ncbi:DUF1579 domain-containing protein [Chitinophaga horti]|uniref:DUF1579 domain-containing protein n=1 Tax=Chitinophaga horti TaxID=2920382 RepID=A0ABY6J424_9BACT|nr:DUF1579 domain-containing protein [Chitinophaga horti]UYQ94415.1 DUF1579 domain-containing protein [Chitinophaga horti]
MEAPKKSKFDISLENGRHRELAKMTGNWKGIAKTWFEPDKLADESPVTASIAPALGGRFLLYQYQGTMMGKPLEGLAIIGYTFEKNSYQVAWIDSFHMGTGILFSESQPGDDQLSVLGSYGGPDIPVPWGWRTEVLLVNDDELVMTAYNITPEGEEAKATEVVYTRIK